MPIFYFRNDDINTLGEDLIAVSRRCTDEGVPITHAVEPANVTDEAVDWLLLEKSKDSRLIEIMQHGYDHKKRDKGEFGGNRPYADQLKDLSRGRQIMENKFGDCFVPCLNYPFGPYNKNSMKAANDIGFRIISSHYNCRLSRRIMYFVGHLLQRGQILDKHVSWHLDKYPGTNLFEVDMAVSFIKSYIGEYGSTECVFHNLEWLINRIDEFIVHTPVIGILLHHRFHTTESSLDLITDLIKHLKTIPGAEFMNMEEVYQMYCPDHGKGFRDE
jgi:peptidoglycan/xylan/chitin deacetylase (PgdA/CDA1 family)